MLSPSDGNITLANNAATSFNLLYFGGTTSSFPALKRTAAALELKEADDVNWTSLTLSNLINGNSDWALEYLNGGLQLASDNSITFSSTTSYNGAKDVGLKRSAAGVAQVTDGSSGRGQVDTNLYTIAGITASTTQTQGQSPLTATMNEVATCANANDVVTVPAATAGRECFIVNNGAQNLQVFPASGDNLGAGVDTSKTIAAGSNAHFVAYNTVNWEEF
jgi:hypothetical protein